MKKFIKIIMLSFLLLIVDAISFSIISFQFDKKQAKKYYESGDYSQAVSLYTNLIERDTNGETELYILNNKPIQEIIAGMVIYNCQVGVVITNNFFTDNAIKIAKANNILLWDRYKLAEFINNTIDDIDLILSQ